MNIRKSEERKKCVMIAVRMTERQRTLLRRFVYSGKPRISISRYVRKVLGIAMKSGKMNDALMDECAKEWQEDEYELEREKVEEGEKEYSDNNGKNLTNKGKKGDKGND